MTRPFGNVTDRFRINTHRVSVPRSEFDKKCQPCGRELAGVARIYGITPVCANDLCQRIAQLHDKGVTIAAHKALPPAKPKSLLKSWTRYAGLVIAYQGNGKWTLLCVVEGFSDLPENEQVEVFRGLNYDELRTQITQASTHVIAHTDDEICAFGGIGGGDKST